MKVERLDHLVLAVEELQQAAAAWAQAFGLEAEPTFRPEGSHLELAALPLGGRDGRGAFLELATATTEDHRVARHVAQWGEGMFSMSVEVEDLDATVRELRAKGVTVSGPEAGALPESRVARIPRASAHGVAVQLIERTRS